MTFEPSDLRSAIERDELFPVFQPVVEMRTGQMTGFEVLARWSHPLHGNILPDKFIPAAESARLISAITETLLRKSFSHEFLVQSSFTLAVNISPIQLLDLSLPQMIARTAEACGFPLQRLVIELTESALLDDLHRAVECAADLKKLGCRLALDDFGTGYSSLRHLHSLPFDALKVDRSFVSSMVQDRGSRKIVSSVIGLGQSLGLVTVAEGVETREQAEMLLWMGCDLGQGWLYGRPAALDCFKDVNAHNRFPVPTASRFGEPAMSIEGPPVFRLAQLQAIYDGAPVGLCLLDRRLRYVSINRQLAEFNGVPVLAHLGRTPEEVIPEVFPQVENLIRRALAGEAMSGAEIHKPPLSPGGESRTLLGSYQPVRDEAGEVIGVSVAIMDVSESKRMEKVIRDVEDHYRSLVKLSPHVPWVLNPAGEVIDAGPRWEAITGQPLQEALGNGWLNVLHPADVEPTVAAIQKSLNDHSQIDIRYRVRNGREIWKWMRSRGAVRLSGSREIMGVYGVVEEMDALEVSAQNEVS